MRQQLIDVADTFQSERLQPFQRSEGGPVFGRDWRLDTMDPDPRGDRCNKEDQLEVWKPAHAGRGADGEEGTARKVQRVQTQSAQTREPAEFAHQSGVGYSVK